MLLFFLKKISYIIFFFLICFDINNGQRLNDFFNSPENRLKFANQLFIEKDYLRALEEYKEYLKVYDNDTVRFKYAECLLRIERFEESGENFKSLFFNSTLEEEAKLNFYRANFLLNLSNNNLTHFREIAEKEIYQSEKFSKYINRLKFISYLFDKSPLPDSSMFFSAFDDSNYTFIKKFYLLKKYPPYKSKTTAGILSAFLPGLGKIYLGETGDGVTAFIATGLLTILSVNNFNNDHQFRGWLFAGLSALTYAGNIYGSVAAAKVYNAKVKSSFINEMNNYFKQRNYFLPHFDFIER